MKIKGKIIFGFFTLFFILAVQNETILASSGKDSTNNALVFNTSFYAETYYAKDLIENKNFSRPNFLYNYNSTTTFATNLFLVKINLEKKNFRLNFSPMYGTYSDNNLSNERGFLKNVFEANFGYKIFKNKNVWLDAGVLPSHIGFESAVGADNLTLTRSVAPENSPYYESGIRLSYLNENEKIYFSFLLLNGWQKIYPKNFVFEPAIGIQLTYNYSKTGLINYSNILVQNNSVGIKYFRFFNNLYLKKQFLQNFSFVAGFDYGMQENVFNNKLDHWLSPQIVVAYQASSTINLALRLENYTDKNNVVVVPIVVLKTPININGISLNSDFRINENFFFRLEAKKLQNSQAIFGELNTLSKQNLMFTFSAFYRN